MALLNRLLEVIFTLENLHELLHCSLLFCLTSLGSVLCGRGGGSTPSAAASSGVDGNNPVAPRLVCDEPEEEEDEEDLSIEEKFYAFCYRDEYYTEMHLENVESFFQWLGIVRQSEVQIVVV